jgi:NAD(P)-dependent dehydrogenase (short-subunit alcohol dehydrogenase family)
MSKWKADQITDQSGKMVIVTGSSSGIGYEAARVLANKGAEVIIAVRNKTKGEAAVKRIQAQNKAAKVKVMILDLADLGAIKNFSDTFQKSDSALDILINNAGVMIPPYTKTANGFELQMGTNHFGHFALTAQLMPILKKTKNSRIVNVSSVAHNYGNLNFEDIHWEKRKYTGWRAYGDSKIANLYMMLEYQNRFSKDRSMPVFTAAHPGWTATELQRHSGFIGFLNHFFAMKIERGALPTLRAATDPAAVTGHYFGPDGFREMRGYPVKAKMNKLAKNSEIAKKLWDISEELTGVILG